MYQACQARPTLPPGREGSPACRVAVLLLALLAMADVIVQPVEAATETIRGTNKADRLFALRGAATLQGLAGDDYISGSDRGDAIEGGPGRDTINPNDGNDQISGGPDGDYFRYGVFYSPSGGFLELTYSADDTIQDFKSGDKLDIYVNGYDFADGGHFAFFDTNKDGLITGLDAYAKVKKLKVQGTLRPSLILDIDAALRSAYTKQGTAGHGGYKKIVEIGHGSLTILGVSQLRPADFLRDYFKNFCDEGC